VTIPPNVKLAFRVFGWISVAALLLGAAVTVWFEMPPGTHCTIRRDLYGVADMDNSYDDFQKAFKIRDDYGIAELVQREKVAFLLARSEGLVIDGTYSVKAGAMYRQVRILGGPGLAFDQNSGKAFWIKREDLAEKWLTSKLP